MGSQSNTPPDLTNVIAIATGKGHSIALRGNGTVFCWGDNAYGKPMCHPQRQMSWQFPLARIIASH